MNEIRIKFKQFVIGSAVVFFLLFYLAFRSPECPSATDAASETAYQQQVPQKTQPFTVYAITPTYARPVQKAELTRLTIFNSFHYFSRDF